MSEVAEAWVGPTALEIAEKRGHANIEHIKFNETRQKEFLRCLETGMTRHAAAQRCGIAYSTVWRFVKQLCPEYAEAMAAAEMSANALVENALFQSAVEDRDVRAQLAWLYSRWPERWRDMRHMNVEGNVKHEVEAGESLSERLEALGSKLEELGASERAELIEAEVVEDEEVSPSTPDEAEPE